MGNYELLCVRMKILCIAWPHHKKNFKYSQNSENGEAENILILCIKFEIVLKADQGKV
jgi:hypothetical protein